MGAAFERRTPEFRTGLRKGYAQRGVRLGLIWKEKRLSVLILRLWAICRLFLVEQFRLRLVKRACQANLLDVLWFERVRFAWN